MSVVSVDIHNKRTYSAGESFGDVGTYDRIEGVIEFAVDPEHDINNKIVDLHLAPRDIFDTDFDRQFYRVTLMGQCLTGLNGATSKLISGRPITPLSDRRENQSQ